MQCLVADLLAVQLNPRLDKLRPVLQRFIHQLFGWLNLLVFRNFHRRSRNHIGICQRRIVKCAAERVLHDQLFQLQVRLRNRQCLLIGCDRALCPHSFNRREATDLHLLLGVRKGLLREAQRFLLHPQIFIGIDQIPIHVLDLIDGGDDLQAECYIGKFTVVLG